MRPRQIKIQQGVSGLEFGEYHNGCFTASRAYRIPLGTGDTVAVSIGALNVVQTIFRFKSKLTC